MNGVRGGVGVFVLFGFSGVFTSGSHQPMFRVVFRLLTKGPMKRRCTSCASPPTPSLSTTTSALQLIRPLVSTVMHRSAHTNDPPYGAFSPPLKGPFSTYFRRDLSARGASGFPNASIIATSSQLDNADGPLLAGGTTLNYRVSRRPALLWSGKG